MSEDAKDKMKAILKAVAPVKGNTINFAEEAAKRGRLLKSSSKPDISQSIINGNDNKQVAKPNNKAAKKQAIVSQTIKNGSNNTQIAGDYNERHNHYNTVNPPDIKILPPPDSIGGNALLKKGIADRFKRIADERIKRFGDSNKAYAIMARNFKSEFGIKKEKYTVYLTWPVECADAIINYLDGLYANTIKGKIVNAASKEGYIHAKPYLFKREKELLECLGLSQGGEEIKKMLHAFFGVDSHSRLDKLELWQFVCYLEGVVKEKLGEVDI